MSTKLSFLFAPLIWLVGIQNGIAQAPPTLVKPFHRALVLSGGGVAPGIPLGILQGLADRGWTPDVILTTCGSSLSVGLVMQQGSVPAALAYAKSPEFHEVMSQLTVATSNALTVNKTFSAMKKDPTLFPDLFSRDLLHFDEEAKGLLDFPFSSSAAGPRYIMVSAKANFKPGEEVGRDREALFTETYFTDSETGKYLQNFPSPIKKIFPASFVAPMTEVNSSFKVGEAARASISDPLLVNPAYLYGSYYFTGAVDLIPIDVAHEVADEVIATTLEPFKDYEDLVINHSFGFTQNASAEHAVLDQTVTFVPPKSREKVGFDPKAFLVWFHSGIPKSEQKFEEKMQAQYDLGYEQALETSLPHVK